MNDLFKIKENSEGEEKLKPCCACPETRDIRDKCIFEKDEEQCIQEINDHKKCLKDYGFEI